MRGSSRSGAPLKSIRIIRWLTLISETRLRDVGRFEEAVAPPIRKR